jgi:hypothetical protein
MTYPSPRWTRNGRYATTVQAPCGYESGYESSPLSPRYTSDGQYATTVQAHCGYDSGYDGSGGSPLRPWYTSSGTPSYSLPQSFGPNGRPTPGTGRSRRNSTSAKQKSNPPHPVRTATEADAKRHDIPAGYSLKNWDPTEKPIILLGSVFDANSLGKWISHRLPPPLSSCARRHEVQQRSVSPGKCVNAHID